MDTEVTVQLTSIAEYSKTAVALADLRERYKGVIFDVTTREGLQTAIKGRAELRGYRVALEKTRVEIKAPALKRAQEIDSEARRITAELLALETPIDDQIKSDERRKIAEAEAKIKAEQERLATEEAERKALEERVLAAQRAEIERQQAELIARQKAQDEAERVAREKIEAEERAARQKIEAERREQQRIIDEQAAKLRAEQAAEAKRVREEEERMAGERRAIEDAQRKERERVEAVAKAERDAKDAAERKKREAEEAKQREAARRKAQSLDGRALLNDFYSRFGSLPEFKAIADQIADFLARAS